MDLFTPPLVGIGLSMDCFAVSLAIGTTDRSRLICAATIIALFFGAFQAGMIVIGWAAGTGLAGFISTYAHWIAFALLAIIGGKMCWEGMSGEEESRNYSIRFIPVVILSFATSIDALAAGVSFGVLQLAILIPASVIGVVCFSISFFRGNAWGTT
jgi:manganese efflux pump family protein